MSSASFFSTTLLFFLIMDPFGNVNSFLSQLRNQTRWDASKIIAREMCIALGLALLIYLVGERLRCTLHLTEPSLYISTGLVLFLAALSILFPGERSFRQGLPEDPKPFLVPLAVPLISGPCLLATVLLYAQSPLPASHVIPSLVTAWVLATAVLMTGDFWERLLGRHGLVAIEKLMSMVLVMLAIQWLSEGIRLFIKALNAGVDLT